MLNNFKTRSSSLENRSLIDKDCILSFHEIVYLLLDVTLVAEHCCFCVRHNDVVGKVDDLKVASFV